ncbi:MULTISPECIES: NAD(P)-binding protein [unclassified Streptomyces]|uniref:NAD-binding protein n=1 Tax=unclassified Streptomyces TaxID=2593676 RepID=UPI00165527A0|nr:NAD(P)-binding protein [Streptomyces sp. CB02980]MCB8901237.1 NAD-binding protein [Streptomyces sp. CB02980]
MVVCGDDALAHRIAGELAEVYRQDVVLVAPTGGGPDTDEPRVRVQQADRIPPDEPTLVEAGVRRAQALALLYEDDEVNMRAAFLARRLNPHIRLVLRMYNRNLGRRMAELLDQARGQARGQVEDRTTADDGPGHGNGQRHRDGHGHDATTIVLSDADTAAPALAATAVTGTRKIVQADGLLLRAAERIPTEQSPAAAQAAEAEDAADVAADPGLVTLALLSSTTRDPAGADGSDRSGRLAPRLLPDDAEVRAAAGHGTVVLEAVTHEPVLPRRRESRGASPRELLSPRVRWALAGVCAAVVALAVTSSVTTGDHLLHAAYLTLLDLFAIGDPAVGEPTARQVLQILAGLLGLVLLPLLIAGSLEALGAYRSAAALRRPPRGLAGHVVLLGLGRIGTRVLVQLHELGVPVVCVEDDPEARGVALARTLRVPVVLGDVTQEGVLEAAKIQRARALLALTSADTTNLEAALYARTLHPDLLVALRLYDDDFASTVYRTLRAAHPDALTRSRSVSTLAAPAFATAMMGRQILGAIAVERRVLVFAALDIAGQPQLEGRTVAEAFRPGAWRVLALDTSAPDPTEPSDLRDPQDGPEPRTRTSAADEPPGLLWDLHPGYVLHPGDRVVVAATRAGLAELLGQAEAPATGRTPAGAPPSPPGD